MRTTRGVVLPILAVLIGCGMIVGAVSVIRLSNVVENTNDIAELPIVIGISATTTTPGGDLPNYQSGSLMPTTSYDMKITYSTTVALGSATIVAQFVKVGISASDVTVAWTDATVWSTISWTLSGDSLTGSLGYTGTQSVGATASYWAKLTYNAPGTYDFSVWVEGWIA